MSDQYSPPLHVVEAWAKHCRCCSSCRPYPCDGVAAGGLCDGLDCICDDYDPDDPDEDDQYSLGPEECYMDNKGQCSMAGSEYCDFECPNGGCS